MAFDCRAEVHLAHSASRLTSPRNHTPKGTRLMSQTSARIDPYQLVTDRIIEQLERGVAMWRCPWQRHVGAPRNFCTGKPYRGVNTLLLGMHRFASPFWMTFCQVKEKGGWIKKDERGSFVLKYGEYQKETPECKAQVEKKAHRFLRQYFAFNAVQIAGVRFPVSSVTQTGGYRNERAEEIVRNMPQPPRIVEGRVIDAAYDRISDVVTMPHFANFDSAEEYHQTLFHELIHSTGHPTRLHRQSLVEHDGFGGKVYSQEELVAEMGAAFLSLEAGIVVDEHRQSAAYLNAWLEVLREKDHRRWIVQSANQAVRAVDFILDQDMSRTDQI